MRRKQNRYYHLTGAHMKDEKEYGEDINFKHWLIRTIMVTILLFTIVGIIEQYFGIELLVTTVLAITVMLMIMFLHEGLHYYKAIKLGYKPIWWRTKWRFGFDTDTNLKEDWRLEEEKQLSPKEKKTRNALDIRKIAVIPYKIIIPLSFALLLIGFFLEIDAVYYAGMASIILHLISYKKEGAITE